MVLVRGRRRAETAIPMPSSIAAPPSCSTSRNSSIAALS
jgi:hypothetical protein